jgi:hypothetical protein
MRQGLFKDILERIGNQTPVIYTIKMSISEDGERARQWGKRQASYGIATRARLAKQLGFNPAEIDAIRQAYDQHLGFEVAASRVSDELFDTLGQVVAGTPSACLAQLEELTNHLKKTDFNLLEVVPGVPLGPDVAEAVRLISRDVVPNLKRWLE